MTIGLQSAQSWPLDKVEKERKRARCQTESANSNADQQANPVGTAPASSEDDQSSRSAMSAGHSSDLPLSGSEDFNDSLQKHIVEARPLYAQSDWRHHKSCYGRHRRNCNTTGLWICWSRPSGEMGKDDKSRKRHLWSATENSRKQPPTSRITISTAAGTACASMVSPSLLKRTQMNWSCSSPGKKWGFHLSLSDIDRSHRFTPRHAQSQGPKVLIVKFTRYNARDQVYRVHVSNYAAQTFHLLCSHYFVCSKFHNCIFSFALLHCYLYSCVAGPLGRTVAKLKGLPCLKKIE